jgi:hypothetical protein
LSYIEKLDIGSYSTVQCSKELNMDMDMDKGVWESVRVKILYLNIYLMEIHLKEK